MMLMLGYYGKAGGGGEGGLRPALGGVWEWSRVRPQVSVGCKGGAQVASPEKLVDRGTVWGIRTDVIKPKVMTKWDCERPKHWV